MSPVRSTIRLFMTRNEPFCPNPHLRSLLVLDLLMFDPLRNRCLSTGPSTLLNRMCSRRPQLRRQYHISNSGHVNIEREWVCMSYSHVTEMAFSFYANLGSLHSLDIHQSKFHEKFSSSWETSRILFCNFWRIDLCYALWAGMRDTGQEFKM